MSAFAQRALIGGLPPSPHFTGDTLLRDGKFYTAGKIRTGRFFSPRGHRPLQSGNLEASALYVHRLLWHNCGSWSHAAGG